ncbi:hypothetical protein PVAND_000310 [Polypedilum vanderplanki]|uniref:F-box domain-containing protein n=1 Tax=Polypedilum vanderplanki TaxID=319348 RepID=A0A9J6BKA1_POLVA|nr:hypothetical protein PVAND_000310 [Polypedilum vanderplanki]
MSESKEVQNRKRKLENEYETEKEEEKVKRILYSKPELLDLADELLMEIAKKLDGESLHNLSLTCSHLKTLVQDKQLWTEAVFTEKDLDIWEILRRLKYLTVGTKYLKIYGDAKKANTETRPLKNRQTFKEIVKRIALRSPLIERLHFHQIWFDWTKDWSITKFPSNLRSLVFTNCYLPKDRNRMNKTFTNIFEHMPQLEELRLEYCNFFEPNDLMPLSKVLGLKVLSLRGCKRFRNCVPYISLSCRFGFKNLEVLDLRETNISDSEMQCLNSLKALKELLLEQPEMDNASDDSDDESEFQPFIRTNNRRSSSRNEEQQPSNGSTNNNSNQEPSSSNQNQQPLSHIPQPSTSRNSHENNDNNDFNNSPSSPESLSDSLPESSSPTEEAPSRTIFIQANITENPNQNARLQVIISDDIPHASRYLTLARNREYRAPLTISDRGMLAFGVPRANLAGNLIFLGNQPNDPNTYLERIVLRNFRNITDVTLSHLQTNAPKLAFLDIRGCSQITREAVESFKITRGSCQLISNFDFEE